MKTSLLPKTVGTSVENHVKLSKLVILTFKRGWSLLETLAIVAILLARRFLTIESPINGETK